MKNILILFCMAFVFKAYAQPLSTATEISDPEAGDFFWVLDATDTSALKKVDFENFFTNVPPIKRGAQDASFTLVDGAITTSPQVGILQTGYTDQAFAIWGDDTAGTYGCSRYNGDNDTKTVLAADDSVCQILAAGYSGEDFEIFGTIDFRADDVGTIGVDSTPGQLRLNVTKNGAVTPTPMIKMHGGDFTMDIEGEDINFLNSSSTEMAKIDTSANQLQINNVTAYTTNSDLTLSGNGTGNVVISGDFEITGGSLVIDSIQTSNPGNDLSLNADPTGYIVLNDPTYVVAGNLFQVDSISSISTDTDLTLTGNGTGGVLANDAFTAVGNTTFIGSAPVRISQGSAMSHNIIYVNDYFSPTLTARNTDMVTVGYTTYDGSTYGFAAREFVSTAPSASCATGAGDLPGRYKVSVSKDGDSTGAGASIQLEGCDDKIEVFNSNSQGLTVDSSADVTIDGGLTIDVGEITSGTYTPTLTDVTNLDASTASECSYLRIGAIVDVACQVTYDPTSAAALEIGISLPISSTFSATSDLTGVGIGSEGTVDTVRCLADTSNNRAKCQGNDPATSNHLHMIKFQYKVI